MTTLLIAEHDRGSLKDVTAKALTAAQALGRTGPRPRRRRERARRPRPRPGSRAWRRFC